MPRRFARENFTSGRRRRPISSSMLKVPSRRRQAKRRQPTSRDITSNITSPTDNTGITSSILKEDYPLYQPQGPTFDQQFENFSENEQLLQCWSHSNSLAAIALCWTSWFHISPNVRESRFRNPGNCGLWNLGSGALKSGIQLKESRIQVPLTNTGIQNPSPSWIRFRGATYLWCWQIDVFSRLAD